MELVSLTYFARGALTISTLGGELKSVAGGNSSIDGVMILKYHH